MGVNGAKNKNSDVHGFANIFFIFLKDLFYKLCLGFNRPTLGKIGGRESVPPGNFRSKGNPPVSPLAPGPKIAWGHTFPAPD